MTLVAKKRPARISLFGRSIVVFALVFGIWAAGEEPIGEEESESRNAELFVMSDPAFSKSLQGYATLECFASEFDRSLAFDEVLLHADTHQLTELLRQSSSITPHSMQLTVRDAVFRRFAMLNPIRALELVANVPVHQQRRMRSAIFQEWASIEFDSLIEHLSAQRSPNRSVAFEAIVEIAEGLSDSEKLILAEKIRLEQHIAEGTVYNSNWENLESIESIWRKATKQTGGASTNSLMKLTRLGDKWIDNEGLGAIAKINESIEDWRLRRAVLRRVVSFAVGRDPKATFEYSLELFSGTDWPLVEQAARHWASIDPTAAISTISQLEPNRQNMELYIAAVSAWASLEPRIVLERLEELPKELREEARLSALSNVTDYSTEEVTQLVEQFNTEGIYAATEKILAKWKDYAFDDAFDWVLSNTRPGHRKPEGLEVVLNDLSSMDAEIAFERALEQPLNQNEIGLEADVLYYFAIFDFDKAIAWLPSVRNAETRFEASARIGLRSMMYEEWDRAITLAGEVPTTERKDYFKRIVPNWFSLSLDDPTDHIEGLPNSESQSKFALIALMFGLSSTMSESLLAKTRFYLSSEDLERIERVEQLLAP
ncbi:MAG: hypothetical protein OXG08_06020 [Gammaproteobacteria bacterium]|nr:hypothetical protein [Gammaproteobacteria bacterium]